MRKKKSQDTTYFQVNDCLTLFDEQFSIADFDKSIVRAERESERKIGSAGEAIRKALSKSGETESKYVVDMDAGLKQAIDNGELKLVKDRAGNTYAQQRSSNGHFGKKIPIKKELEEKGLTEADLEQALNMEIIAEQLQTMIDLLKQHESRIKEIARGQQDDRVGLFYSGLNQFLEAKNTKDESLRRLLIAQSLQSINDANAQTIQNLKSNIEYLINKNYMKQKNNVENLIDEHLSVIQHDFGIIYRSAILKATIYQHCGETENMLAAVGGFGRFIELMIVPYIGNLSELDEGDKFIESGVWGSMAKTMSSCEALKDSLDGRSSYLEYEED